MKYKSLFIAILSLIISIALDSNAEIKAGNDSQISVAIKASMLGVFKATTNQISLSEKEDALVFSVPLDTLTTGIDLRDIHMKKDLDVEHYPKAILEVVKSNIVKQAGTANGKFTINGQTHPLDFSYSKNDAGKVEATAIMNITNWGIPARKYMGVGVKEVVVIQVNFSIINQ